MTNEHRTLVVRRTICKHMQPPCGLGGITDESRLYEDLGMDSLDAVELAMAIEEELGIELPDLELTDCETFGGLMAIVNKAAG